MWELIQEFYLYLGNHNKGIFQTLGPWVVNVPLFALFQGMCNQKIAISYDGCEFYVTRL